MLILLLAGAAHCRARFLARKLAVGMLLAPVANFYQTVVTG